MEAAWKRWVRVWVLIAGWILVGAGGAWGQHFEDCIQNVENATIIVPASVQASVGTESLEEGDEIALYTGDGTCAGRGVWDGESLSMAAAGAGSQQPDGFEPGEVLAFRVWNASGEQVYQAEVTYAACEEGGALCREDGAYEDNVLFSLAAMNAEAPLPVELVSFEATVNGEEALLQWKTASETSNAGFEVQHQDPQLADDTWTRVAFVQGQGTTSVAQSYSYRVQDLFPGTHRFRLKQVDLDGATEHTGIVEATVELADTYEIAAPYPNPFRQRATFALTVAEAQRVDIVAYNQLGQHVATLHSGQLKPNASHTFQLDGSRLSSGMYFIRVRGEEFSTTERAILVR